MKAFAIATLGLLAGGAILGGSIWLILMAKDVRRERNEGRE